ncbi:hypothetical protein V8D89_002698 [Ganoderma adspersum]
MCSMFLSGNLAGGRTDSCFIAAHPRAREAQLVPLAKFLFEPSVRKWCRVAAHRWILHDVYLLCEEFRLRSGGHGLIFRSEFWDLFSAIERRRSSDNPRDSETVTATDGTSAPLTSQRTTQPVDSEEGGLKDMPDVPASMIEDREIDGMSAAMLAAGVPECRCDLCVETW